MQRLVIRCGFLVAMLGATLSAQSPAFVMLNAASYDAATAPDSLASVFGASLAQTTATATLDANGQLPTELAATRVEIAGVAAQLFYVSPTQINLVIPGTIDPGTVDVVVRSTASGATRTATAFLRAAAPGVFTNDASGTGPGAILNAVTYTPSPFLVQTPGAGTDTRTRLAVYGTGFRHAQTVIATAQDITGNRYTLIVEFSGPAPGFIGLDQVNVLIPPDLDGAGTVSLQLVADGNPANSVTFQVDLLPLSALQLYSVAIAPAFVSAGDTAVLTVVLTGVARTGGFPVALRSTGASAQVAAQLVIPAGRASAQTTVATLTVPAPVTPTIIAQAGGVSLSVPLEIDPSNTAQLTSISVTPASILGGRNLIGTVTLSGPASGGGVNVLVAADSDRVRVPPTGVVAVPFGMSSANFPITTLAVTQPQTVTLMATLSRTNVTATLNVLPPLQLSLSLDSVVAGGTLTGTLTLGDPAPVTGATINLQSSNGAVVVPPFVTIAAGQSSLTFPITTTTPLPSTRVVTITAAYLGFTQTASITVTPQLPPALSSLTISPNPVTSGNNAQGTVTLTAPATAGTAVSLISNSAMAFVPGSVTVPQGQTSVNFSVTTIRGLTGAATITASFLGVSKSVTLGVQ